MGGRWSYCLPEWYLLMLHVPGREQLPVLDEGSFAVPCYSLVKPFSVYPFDISGGGIVNICCAMNVVLQWMLDFLRFNHAFASETVLHNVLLTSALHIAAICLELCFGVGGCVCVVDWNTSVNILLRIFLKPWWQQYWTENVLIPAPIFNWSPRLFPCEIEIQHILHGGPTEHLTHKHIPVVSFSWSTILRADFRVGKGEGQRDCPAKTMTLLESPFEHSAAGCVLQL